MKQQITEEFLKTITKWNVMAIDTASHSGWFTAHGYGTQYFPNTEKAPKKLGENYEQHVAFRQWVKEKIQQYNIKLMVAEDVEVSKSFIAMRKLAEFRGILFEICATLNVPILLVGVTQLKKWATGNGNASKELMMEYAVKRWHLDPENDDNIADAAHLFFYAIKRYNISTK